jgi:hypothetical protein
LVPLRVGEIQGKGVGGWKYCKYYVHLYANGKMRPVETTPGMEEGDVKENDGGGDLNPDIL